jgi:hypothetical protein
MLQIFGTPLNRRTDERLPTALLGINFPRKEEKVIEHGRSQTNMLGSHSIAQRERALCIMQTARLDYFFQYFRERWLE